MVGRIGKDLFRLAADLLQLLLHEITNPVVNDVLDFVDRHVLQRFANVPIFLFAFSVSIAEFLRLAVERFLVQRPGTRRLTR